jgi:hypothetical protein
MRPELRAQIIAFNKVAAQRKEKAEDLDILVSAMLQLPPGQLKKLLNEDVLAVLAKYGYTEGEV